MIGPYIKQLRKNNKLTQAKLSKRSGVSIPEISAIENMKRPTPKASTLQKLAPYLGVETEDLLRAAGYTTNKVDFSSLSPEQQAHLIDTGKRLRLARENAGLSLKEASENAGIRISTLRKNEEGQCCKSPLNLSQLFTLSQIYNTNPSYFFSRDYNFVDPYEFFNNIYTEFLDLIKKRVDELNVSIPIPVITSTATNRYVLNEIEVPLKDLI